MTLDLDRVISLVAALGGIVAAVFAALAYFEQIGFRRKKFKLRVRHGRDDSHITITASNEGRRVRLETLIVETDGFPNLKKVPFKELEYGASVDVSFCALAYDKIPVDVKSRIVISLADGSALRSRPVALAKIVKGKEFADFVMLISDKDKATV